VDGVNDRWSRRTIKRVHAARVVRGYALDWRAFDAVDFWRSEVVLAAVTRFHSLPPARLAALLSPEATVALATSALSLHLSLWRGEEQTASVPCITGSRPRLRRRLVHRRARDYHRASDWTKMSPRWVKVPSRLPLPLLILTFLYPLHHSVSLSTSSSSEAASAAVGASASHALVVPAGRPCRRVPDGAVASHAPSTSYAAAVAASEDADAASVGRPCVRQPRLWPVDRCDCYWTVASDRHDGRQIEQLYMYDITATVQVRLSLYAWFSVMFYLPIMQCKAIVCIPRTPVESLECGPFSISHAAHFHFHFLVFVCVAKWNDRHGVRLTRQVSVSDTILTVMLLRSNIGQIVHRLLLSASEDTTTWCYKICVIW